MKHEYVKRFSDLEVYKKQRVLSKAVFEISKHFSKVEQYALTDQMRRSARSIGAQIAEAWGKRRYKKHWVSKLTDSESDQLDTQHWLIEAFDCGYISEKDHVSLTQHCAEIGRMLGAMIRKAESFTSGGLMADEE